MAAEQAGTGDSDAASTTSPQRPSQALRAPAIVLGVGLGGFFDGIFLHQVFQLHHMLSNTGQDNIGLATYPVDTVAGLRVNTLWDGLFHVTAYAFVLVGVVWLWRRWRSSAVTRPPWRLLGGALLVGWGLFNLVEGVVDHHILAIHHVYAGDLQLLWDLLFLAAGAAMVIGGGALLRGARSGDEQGT